MTDSSAGAGSTSTAGEPAAQMQPPPAPPPPATSPEGGQPGSAESLAARSAAAAKAARDESSPVFGFLFFAFIGYVWFWNSVTSMLVRVLGGAAIVLVAVVWLVVLYQRGQGDAAWAAFRRQAVLLGWIALTVLGAPALAVLLRQSDRTLALKLATIMLLSFLPAWLYWQFIEGKGRALWDEFVTNLYRLGVDHPVALPRPPVQSVFYGLWRRNHDEALGDPKIERRENLYRKKFEGVYGTHTDDMSERVLVENGVPAILATVLFSLGWLLVLQPETVFTRTLFGREVTLAPAWVPLAEIRYAFLGAYFYSLQMLMRRYYQNDLKTSAYINAIVRVVVVVLLAWILSAVWAGAGGGEEGSSAAWRYGIAFTIGVFPDVGWQLLQKALKIPAQWIDESLRVRYPLSDIDGLNLWYQSRLLEEGIEDMQTLVTANLVDVMLHTRIPMDRLVDWIDQAVLLLHLPEEGADADAQAHGARALLGRLGIRNATELISVYDHRAMTFRVPSLASGSSEPALPVLVAVAETARREPVMHYIVQWKSFPYEYLSRVGEPPEETVGRYVPTAADRARRSLGIEPVSAEALAEG